MQDYILKLDGIREYFTRKNNMEKCINCNIKFPDHLIQPLFHNGDYSPMCPICALQKINDLHGLPANTPFHGEMAQASYEEAIEFLKK
jgi:hypothetical protein